MTKEPKSKPEIAEAAETRAGIENSLTDRIIGAAIEVHRHLGPGLLESAYEECLCYELSQMRLEFKRQVHLPIRYKGISLDCGHKMDLVVEDRVVVEIKAIDSLLSIHTAQLLTYLKSSGKPIGLLINFNVPVLRRGLKRIVNRYDGPLPRASAEVAALPLNRGDAEARRIDAENAHDSAPSALDSREDAALESLISTPRFSPRLRVSAVNTKPMDTEIPVQTEPAANRRTEVK